MAVVENITTASGDILFLKTDIPAIGLIALLSYSESVIGETVDIQFKREFSYSFDNILWAPWQLLNIDNLTNVQVQPNKPLFLQYKYTREGSNNVDPATWEDTEIQATLQDNTNDALDFYFNMSDFKCLFENTDLNLLNWYLNVTEKIYRQNLLPVYIERAFSDNFEDKDFIDFWLSVSKFFSYYVYFARKITKIKDNNSSCSNLLLEYLTQWGMYLCGDETNEELNNIRKSLYNEFAKRGTYNVIKDEDNIDGTVGITGEFLRLICYNKTDEFIFALFKPEHFSWNVNNCSPLYKGMFFNINANKAYEKTQFKDLSLYPIIDSSNASIVLEGDKKVLQFIITPGGGAFNGFDYSGTGKLIKINPYLSYECTFLIKNTGNPGAINIDFGVKTFKVDYSADTISDAAGISDQVLALSGKVINTYGDYKMVRLFIYGFLETGFETTDKIYGTLNYRFKESNKYIVPYLKITVPTEEEVTISDFRITPAYTTYERFLMGVKNFLSIWLLNNSENDKDKIEDVLSHYLLPYNIVHKISYLNDLQPESIISNNSFKLLLYFDWTNVDYDADYSLLLKIYENGTLKPISEYFLNVDNGVPLPDQEIVISENYNYSILFSHNYKKDLQYSFDNVNWFTLTADLFYSVLNTICSADIKIYLRVKLDTEYNQRVTFSNDIVVTEGNVAYFAIDRIADIGATTVVSYETEDGTATAGVNYSAISSNVTFLSGETQKIIPVVTNIHVGTGPLNFKLKITAATNGCTIVDDESICTINDEIDGGEFVLEVKKESWVGFARAEITAGDLTFYSLENDNPVESTAQKIIQNKTYSLKVFAEETPSFAPVLPAIAGYEVSCNGETKYLIGINNVTFDLLKTHIANKILVLFRKLTWIGYEQTALCDCTDLCIYQYETVKIVGSNITHDVRYYVFDGLSYVLVKQHSDIGSADYQSKISDLGGSFKILISASNLGVKMRITVWGTSGVIFFQQDYTSPVVDLEFLGMTPNIYVTIEEII